MYKVLVTFRMKPGTMEAALAAGQTCLAESRKEPGCLGFDFYRATDGSETFVAVESFVDKAAHTAHQASQHFLDYIPLLRANWDSVVFETVNPA